MDEKGVKMNDEYEMQISDTRWWSYDIPGNIGWIIWIVCTIKNLKKRVIRGFGALTVGGALGIPISLA